MIIFIYFFYIQLLNIFFYLFYSQDVLWLVRSIIKNIKALPYINVYINCILFRYRAEVIGALVSVLMIWVVTAILFYLAVLRIVERNFELNGEIMLISSGIGILVNIM